MSCASAGTCGTVVSVWGRFFFVTVVTQWFQTLHERPRVASTEGVDLRCRNTARRATLRSCGCGRAKWSICSHPYVDYKVPKDHKRRSNERYRKNLDLVAGKHVDHIRDAQDEARRVITAWLDGRDAKDLQPCDRPTLAATLKEYSERPNAAKNGALQIKPLTSTSVNGRAFGEWRLLDITADAIDAFRLLRPTVAGNRNLALSRAPCSIGRSVAGWPLQRRSRRARCPSCGSLAKSIARGGCRSAKKLNSWRSAVPASTRLGGLGRESPAPRCHRGGTQDRRPAR